MLDKSDYDPGRWTVADKYIDIQSDRSYPPGQVQRLLQMDQSQTSWHLDEA